MDYAQHILNERAQKEELRKEIREEIKVFEAKLPAMIENAVDLVLSRYNALSQISG